MRSKKNCMSFQKYEIHLANINIWHKFEEISFAVIGDRIEFRKVKYLRILFSHINKNISNNRHQTLRDPFLPPLSFFFAHCLSAHTHLFISSRLCKHKTNQYILLLKHWMIECILVLLIFLWHCWCFLLSALYSIASNKPYHQTSNNKTI